MRAYVYAALLAAAACDLQQWPRQDEPKPPPPVTFDGALATEAAARVGHGRRIADVLGCTGCHGGDLQGRRFYELYASNLTREMPKYGDPDFERLLRAGVHPTGREVWGMPSEVFQHLSDADVAALLAYLRSLPPAGPPNQPHLPFEPETKKLIAEGKIKPAAAWVQQLRALAPPELGASHALGRYVSRVTCAECHGPELKGNTGDTPDLIVAGAYSREEFEQLMTEGIPTGGRKLNELMSAVSKERFSKMTPHERDALYAYLKRLAEQPR